MSITNPIFTAEELLHSKIEPPEHLDYLEFEFNKVTFRCFGILHGITGGLNQDYREFIKKEIRDIKGIKLAEKGMKQLYRNCGINDELEDWLVLRNIDCFIMGFQLIADPRCLWMITIDALREQLRKYDPFVKNNKNNITDLGESTYFHYLDEVERRELAGFIPSEQALKNDINSMSHWYKAILSKSRYSKFEHPQWKRILLLERLMHIPCRSIHMLHYALAYAEKHEHKLINIFIGETHNTDMLFLANNIERFKNSLNEKQLAVMTKIITTATHFSRHENFKETVFLLLKKVNYLSFILLGAIIPLIFYVLIFIVISK